MSRWWAVFCCVFACQALAAERPNFLFVITDDQSWAHTSYAGFPYVKTPAFDRLASQGVYFEKAFVSAPSCTASRSSILSGRHFWLAESGALLWGRYPSAMPNFIHQLMKHGYDAAYTGKGWGPGMVPDGVEPTGWAFRKNIHKVKTDYDGLAGYADDFSDFLFQRDPSQPFFFWAGIFEPHREYLEMDDTNRFAGKPEFSEWPAFMPYSGRSQKQMTRYLEEIEYADAEVGRMLDSLDEHGLLDTTVIVFTSDNGMPFAGAKSNLYQYGVQVPLAILLPKRYKGQKLESRELVSLIDIAPTVLELAGAPALEGISGRSLVPLLKSESDKSWVSREFILVGFERHAPNARPDYSTYPMRGLISREWIYVKNYKPQRWPQGAPDKFFDTFMGHLLTYKGRQIEPFFTDLLKKRPERELYRMGDAPGAANNKAIDPAWADTVTVLDKKLEAALQEGADPGLRQRDYFMRYARTQQVPEASVEPF